MVKYLEVTFYVFVAKCNDQQQPRQQKRKAKKGSSKKASSSFEMMGKVR